MVTAYSDYINFSQWTYTFTWNNVALNIFIFVYIYYASTFREIQPWLWHFSFVFFLLSLIFYFQIIPQKNSWKQNQRNFFLNKLRYIYFSLIIYTKRKIDFCDLFLFILEKEKLKLISNILFSEAKLKHQKFLRI